MDTQKESGGSPTRLVVRCATLWGFVTEAGIIYDDMYGMYSDGMTYAEARKMSAQEQIIRKEEWLGQSDWTLYKVKKSGVEAHIASSHGFDLSGFGFTIVRLATKGGVVLRGGDDIMEFLKDLAEEV